jgi:hypothetical protein
MLVAAFTWQGTAMNAKRRDADKNHIRIKAAGGFFIDEIFCFIIYLNGKSGRCLFEDSLKDGFELDIGTKGRGGRRGGDDLEAQAVLAGLQGLRHIEFKRRHP